MCNGTPYDLDQLLPSFKNIIRHRPLIEKDPTFRVYINWNKNRSKFISQEVAYIYTHIVSYTPTYMNMNTHTYIYIYIYIHAYICA